MAKQQPQPQQTKEKQSSVVHPLVRSVGQKHVLEEIFDGEEEDIPELKAIGYAKVTNKAGGWVSYVITFKGNKVTKIEVTDPEQRAIVQETSKIDFVQTFMDKEF
jgi:hypothetical protein